MKTLIPCFLGLAAISAHAAVEYSDVKLADGSTIQTCARFPDSKKFPGPRPALMINFGSGLYDYCRDRTIQSDYVDSVIQKGVVVFISLKRGIRHNPQDNTFTSNLSEFSKADFTHLKSDYLQAFEFFSKDKRINPLKMSLWGGSEGTVLSTYIALHHPEVMEVNLASSMVENFPQVYARQMYEILPAQMISLFDKNKDGFLSTNEITDSYLRSVGLDAFSAVDTSHDGHLSATELSSEIKTVISRSLQTGSNTFFLSELGGYVTANWVKSALIEEPLGPQILDLKMPVHMYHGTADVNTLIQPIYELERQAKELGKSNLSFTYFQGVEHELSKEIIAKTLIDSADRISK